RHTMPVVQCLARWTWDDKYDTHCKRINTAIHTRNGGITLCSLWQCGCSCHEKHDHMHCCSDCGATTHGASKCP
ncbi:hypothetical protein PAXRUDRAFT_168716, partial [Paxillus rubicundulus Ve08.2h10]